MLFYSACGWSPRESFLAVTPLVPVLWGWGMEVSPEVTHTPRTQEQSGGDRVEVLGPCWWGRRPLSSQLSFKNMSGGLKFLSYKYAGGPRLHQAAVPTALFEHI